MYVRSDEDFSLMSITGRDILVVQDTDSLRVCIVVPQTAPRNRSTIMCYCNASTDAISRMDDVTEWLNAERVYWDDHDVKHVKPRVYEFGKPIGYWRQR